MFVRQGNVIVAAELEVAVAKLHPHAELPELVVGLGIEHVDEDVGADEDTFFKKTGLGGVFAGERGDGLRAKEVAVAQAQGAAISPPSP